MRIAILTEEQKNALQGQVYDESGTTFNCVEHEGNWIITEPQIKYCTVPEFQWVKQLALIEI